MTVTTMATESLKRLPRSDRWSELEAMVTTQFRSALMMDPAEDLTPTESVFALGFSSLMMTEMQDHLSKLFGIELGSSVLLNSCTIRQISQYIAAELPENFFPEVRQGVRPIQGESSRLLWDNLLDRVVSDRSA